MIAALGPVRPQVAAVVLAAGWSSRMGAFKPLLPFANTTVVEHVIASLQAAGVELIYVVVGHEAGRLAPVVAANGATAVVNPDFDRGMMTSVKAGIAALPPTAMGAMILPVDIPLVRPATLARIVECAVDGDAAVLRPTFRGQAGHPPFIRRRLFDAIRDGGPDATLRDILDRHRPEIVPVTVFDSGCLRDMDNPDDYRSLAAAATRRRHPDDAECDAMLDAMATSEPTRRHGRAVARLAVDMASRLAATGVVVDIDLVRAGALLHDGAKGEPDHARIGGQRIADFGFAETADVVAHHMDLRFAAGDPIDERVVVVLADKLVSGETRVSLDDRFAPAFARFANDRAALAGARRRHGAVAAMLAAVAARIGPIRQDAAEAARLPPQDAEP